MIFSTRRPDADADHAEAIIANRPAWKQAIRDRLDALKDTARMEAEAAMDLQDEEAGW